MVRELSADSSCGVTLSPDGRARTVAASDDRPSQVDEIQYEYGDGPCLHPMRAAIETHIPDTPTGSRWPGFGGRRSRTRSAPATPFPWPGRVLGAFNPYATKPDACHRERIRVIATAA